MVLKAAMFATFAILLCACDGATSVTSPESVTATPTSSDSAKAHTNMAEGTESEVYAACAEIADYAANTLFDYKTTKPEAWFGFAELLELVDPQIGDGQFQLAITALSVQSATLGTQLQGQMTTQVGDIVADEVTALDKACSASGYSQ